MSLFLFLIRNTFVMQTTTNGLKSKLMTQSKANNITSQAASVLMKSMLLVVLISAFAVNVKGQGWELAFGGDKEDQGLHVIQTNDHGYLTVGFSESFAAEDQQASDNDLDIYVVRTDVDGTLIWQEVFDEGVTEFAYSALQTEDEGFLIVGDIVSNPGENPNVYLLKISKEGKFEWSQTYGDADFRDRGLDLVKSPDGGYLIIGKTNKSDSGENDILLVKVDNDGTLQWTKNIGSEEKEEGTALAVIPNGYAYVGNLIDENGSDRDILLGTLDLNGDQVWTDTVLQSGDDELANDVILTENGDLVLVGAAETSTKGFIARYTIDGTPKWYQWFDLVTDGEFDWDDEFRSVYEAENNDLIAVGYAGTNGFNIDALLVAFDADDGNELWKKNYGDDEKTDSGESVAPNIDGGYVIAGYNSKGFPLFINDVLLIKTDREGDIITNFITGTVFGDNEPCQGLDPEDRRLEDWIVVAKGTDRAFYGTTDEDGRYSIRVDSGSYEVTVVPSNDYWEPCVELYSVEFNEFYDTTSQVDFPVKSEIVCPYLEVDVSAEFLTVCSDIDYTVAYCNLGTGLAPDSYVDVMIDEDLTFVSASIPVEVLGDTLRFLLGNLDISDCGSFVINTQMACEGIATGQAGLVEARIYPNEICTEPSPDWDESSIIVTGECDDNNEVKFTIINAGDGDMNEDLQFIVVEDDLMFLNGTFNLPADGFETLDPIPNAGGSTYRLIAQQSSDHPGMSNPSIAVEGCTTGDNSSVGQVTQFPENDQDPFVSIDVQEASGSEEQVELRGYPKGYRDSIITPNTDITYIISFKNFGTDTISRVVIRDTLSEYLDNTAIFPGTSSHPYDFEVYNNGILKITFDEIQLQPNSSAEESLTRGFVKFRIAQKPDNPVGASIFNSAAVYFDYFDPVMTNTVHHVIDCIDYFPSDFQDPEAGCLELSEDHTIFIISDIDEPGNLPEVKINVYPNPFFELATIEIEEAWYPEVEMKVFDAFGRIVRNERFSGTHYDFYRKNLPSGLYMYKLESEGQTINTGKLIVR